MGTVIDVLVVVGSASQRSRTWGLAHRVANTLRAEELRVHELNLRDLPADALLQAQFDAPEIKAASALVAECSGLVLASPVYKAAYSGLLKCFLDLQPQFGLRGKTVLPLLTGGSLAHVLVLDYALRPVLQSMEPRLIVSGLFVLDKSITLHPEHGTELDADVDARLNTVVRTFLSELPQHAAHSRALAPSRVGVMPRVHDDPHPE